MYGSRLSSTFRTRSSFNVFRTCARGYALSRFPDRKPVGTGRSRRAIQSPQKTIQSSENASPVDSNLWQESLARLPSNPTEKLRDILMSGDTLIIERQLEMLNVFIGFEQCNKYSISTLQGQVLGYITEEAGGFLSSFNRQLMGTRRPFKAVILHPDGSPVLWLRRPFAFINSRMYVQAQAEDSVTEEASPVLDTIAEVQQVWHPWRRRYDIFLQKQGKRVLSLANETQSSPEPEAPENVFTQFGHVDSGFLAWSFPLRNESDEQTSLVTRRFRGFGREIFTDTGIYAVHFGPQNEVDQGISEFQPQSSGSSLSLEERAATLALAINIDVDYFSRHSGPGGGMFHFGGFDSID